MTQMTTNDIANRLNQLERQNRNLRRSLIGLGLSVAVLMTAGAAFSARSEDLKDSTFATIHASKLIMRDSDGRERIVMKLDHGEPTLEMFNHQGKRQVFLGIDELWDDTAYLSVSSRLPNGDVDKQAVLAATTSSLNSSGNSQLVLFDAKPNKDDIAIRNHVRLSSGLPDQKPFLEIREASNKAQAEVNLHLLMSELSTSGRQTLLDTNADPATLSGVKIAP